MAYPLRGSTTPEGGAAHEGSPVDGRPGQLGLGRRPPARHPMLARLQVLRPDPREVRGGGRSHCGRHRQRVGCGSWFTGCRRRRRRRRSCGASTGTGASGAAGPGRCACGVDRGTTELPGAPLADREA